MEHTNLYNNQINNLSELADKLNISPEYRPQFWKDMLQWIRTYKDNNNSPFLNQELKSNSLMEIINRYCDLPKMKDDEHKKYKEQINYFSEDNNDGIEVSEIFADLLDVAANGNTNNDFWNESVQKTIKLLYDYFLKEDNEKKPVAGINITVDDIKQADAAYNYIGKPWVMPNLNFNNDEYQVVRGHDQVINTLNRNNKSQFTHTQNQNQASTSIVYDENNKKLAIEHIKKWLRLIMPQYARRVEIEDLDRNFWVIAQILAEISGFLFDEDSPLTNIIRSLLEETLQLWENVFSLWMDFAATTQKENNDIRTIVFYIQGSEIENQDVQHYKKYNDIERSEPITKAMFTIGGNNNIIDKYINEYTQKYPEQNLVLMPIVRYNNYQHNYYSTEYYPAIYTIFRKYNKNGKPTQENIKTYWLKFNENILKFSAKDVENNAIDGFEEYVYATKLTTDGYQYCAPFNNVETFKTYEQKSRYYCAIRIAPFIKALYNQNRDGIILSQIDFSVFDAAEDIIDNTKQPLFTFYNDSEISNNEIILKKEQKKEKRDAPKTSEIKLCLRGAGMLKADEKSEYITDSNNQMAFYQGEVISWYKYPKIVFDAKIIKKWILNDDFPRGAYAKDDIEIDGKTVKTFNLKNTKVGTYTEEYVIKGLSSGKDININFSTNGPSGWTHNNNNSNSLSVDNPQITITKVFSMPKKQVTVIKQWENVKSETTAIITVHAYGKTATEHAGEYELTQVLYFNSSDGTQTQTVEFPNSDDSNNSFLFNVTENGLGKFWTTDIQKTSPVSFVITNQYDPVIETDATITLTYRQMVDYDLGNIDAIIWNYLVDDEDPYDYLGSANEGDYRLWIPFVSVMRDGNEQDCPGYVLKYARLYRYENDDWTPVSGIIDIGWIGSFYEIGCAPGETPTSYIEGHPIDLYDYNKYLVFLGNFGNFDRWYDENRVDSRYMEYEGKNLSLKIKNNEIIEGQGTIRFFSRAFESDNRQGFLYFNINNNNFNWSGPDRV